MKECYIVKNFKPAVLRLIGIVDQLVDDYQAQGYRLTTRQLYYQLVARDIIPNTVQEYKRVASIINDAKLAGLIDWEAIEDRTREFVRETRWESGAAILRAAQRGYHQDMWDNQMQRVFVVVEKEALVGILEPTCREYDVPLLAARGYPSGTVLREFVESDVIPALDAGQRVIVLHLGDHDPSGIDMSRDLMERIKLFAHVGEYSEYDGMFELERIALNMAQIEEVRPPENPAKVTDSRFDGYMKRFGTKSWELDALSPSYLTNLLSSQIDAHIDPDHWQEKEAEIEDVKFRILAAAETFV